MCIIRRTILEKENVQSRSLRKEANPVSVFLKWIRHWRKYQSNSKETLIVEGEGQNCIWQGQRTMGKESLTPKIK